MKPNSMVTLTTACALLVVSGCASKADNIRERAVAMHLSRGQALIEQADWQQALAQCQAGIDTLGSYFPEPPICDADGRPVTLLEHTREHLMVAGILQRDGKVADAAQSVCSVLKSRISIAKMANNTCRWRTAQER